MRIKIIKAVSLILGYDLSPTRFDPPVWLIKERKSNGKASR